MKKIFVFILWIIISLAVICSLPIWLLISLVITICALPFCKIKIGEISIGKPEEEPEEPAENP